MVTTFYPPYNFGGDGIYVYRLSNELARRGHKVDIIYSLDAYYSLKSDEPSGKFLNHPNVRVHGLKSKLGFLSNLLTHQTGYPYFKSNKIKNIIENGKFDVLHFHNVSLIGGPKVLEFGNAIKLYTMHEYWLVCQTHVLFKYNQKACENTTCFLCAIVHKRFPQLWRYTNLLNKSLRQVDALIAPSRFASDMHHKMGLDFPTVHIPMFAPKPNKDNEFTHKTNLRINIEKPYFLFVGRLEKLKGLQDLIHAFIGYHNADLLVAGTGNYLEKLQRLASGIPRIKFLGEMNQEDLMSLYSDAIALIMPSLSYEIFPLVIVEAFSMKTPVIAKNIGALKEIVEQSGGGILYNEEHELIEAVELLRTKPEKRKELQEKGYSTYSKCWTEEKHLEKYLDLVEDLINKKKPASLS